MDKINLIRQLREETHISMAVCKQALEATGWDHDAAVKYIREKGLGVPDRGGKVAAEGALSVYMHAGCKLAVLLEVNTETDFAAKSPEFAEFCELAAMQIAAMAPEYVSMEDIPQAVRDENAAVFHTQLQDRFPKWETDEKARTRLAQAVEGKMRKWYQEVCLLEQECVKDDGGAKRLLKDMLTDLGTKVREKVVVRRFVRWQVGEGLKKKSEDFASESMKMAGLEGEVPGLGGAKYGVPLR